MREEDREFNTSTSQELSLETLESHFLDSNPFSSTQLCDLKQVVCSLCEHSLTKKQGNKGTYTSQDYLGDKRS